MSLTELNDHEFSYLGTYTFGTPGGDDLDLRILCEQVPPPEKQTTIKGLFEGLGKVDLLFITREELEQGRIHDITEFGAAETYLRHGFDPHEHQVAAGDTSLFSLYIFATMQEFHEVPGSPLPSPQSALEKVQLTAEGAIGWTHFYAGCFLDEYRAYMQGERSSENLEQYQSRLAKFFARITLGSTLAQLNPDQLATIKVALAAAVEQSDEDYSTDENMTEILTNFGPSEALLSEETKKLLQLAGDIRSGRETDITVENFCARAEALLFYHAYQQGIEKRLEAGQEVDYLTSYAFEMLIRSHSDLARRVVLSAETVFLERGSYGNEFYYVPLKTSNHQDNPGVRIFIGESGDEEAVERMPGNVFGEISALFGTSRSATAMTTGETEAWVVSGDKMAALLADPTILRELDMPVLQSERALLADVLLRYLTREGSKFLRRTHPHSVLSPGMVSLRSDQDPLAQYDLGGAFYAAVSSFVTEPLQMSPVVSITASELIDGRLFDAGIMNDWMYVAAPDTRVTVHLRNGETFTVEENVVFGESALLGEETTGSASMAEGGAVLAINAAWFKRITQSRQPITAGPEYPAGIMPARLLYHLAFLSYSRVQARLA